MNVFLQSLGSQFAKTVTKSFSIPDGDEDTWPKIATKKFDANAKSHYALLQALNDNDIARGIHYKFTHEIWSRLVVIHEGTSHFKRVGIDLLHFQYENFAMNDEGSINDMITKFTKITNSLASLGDGIDND